MSSDIEVLLVQDHLAYAEALEAAFPPGDGLHITAVVQQPEEAARIARQASLPAALVDVDMPNGIEALDALQKTAPSTGLAAITRSTDPVKLGCCVQAGAAGVVMRSSSLEEVRSILETVAGAGNALPANRLSHWLRSVAVVRERHWRGGVLASQLTPTERHVLEMLNEADSTEDIAKSLAIARSTAATHIRNVLLKIGAKSRLQAVVEAQRVGLLDAAVRPRLPEEW